MTLSLLLARQFEDKIRARGHNDHTDGRIRIVQGSDTEVQADVTGGQYSVSLSFEDGYLGMYCGCPAYEQWGPCRHLWATILAAEANGFLKAVEAAQSVTTVCEDFEAFDDDFDPLGRRPQPIPPKPVLISRPPPPPPPKPPEWRQRLNEIAESSTRATPSSEAWPARRQIIYVVDAVSGGTSDALAIEVLARDPKASGDWSKPKELRLPASRLASLPDATDRKVLAAVNGASEYYSGWSYAGYNQLHRRYELVQPLAGLLMPLIARTGRCFVHPPPHGSDLLPLAWDDGGPWSLCLRINRAKGGQWAVAGALRRGEERMGLNEPLLIARPGFVVTRERIAPLALGGSFEWIEHLRKKGQIEAPEADVDGLLAALLEQAGAPPLEAPEELHFEEVRVAPRPLLKVRIRKERQTEQLVGELAFDYAGRIVPHSLKSNGHYAAEERKFYARDLEAEQAGASQLLSLGMKLVTPPYSGRPEWQIAPSKLPRLVRDLVLAGWHVEAEGKSFRAPGSFRAEISTGIDWFELHGEVEYGETSARLPALLEALRRGENMVRLDDGTYGMLPEEWLRRLAPLADLGTAEPDHLRFRRNQAGLLDALLATQPEVRFDEAFSRVRDELRRFEGIAAAEQPAGFQGQLRDYQRDGVGWMNFLRQFGFGGCLADDMGVGKTAQVLALLETRRELRERGGEAPAPSLVVVPKSLVFNWKQEAARFTPQLRIVDHTGLGRRANGFEGCDVVLTTYGTLRRDAILLKDVEFDYIVLDEAQAIKNADTESAKAVRLLRGRHRLALSGTPVENHLGELWSLFEFLNPGMLGAASVFKLAGGTLRNPGEETRRLLACALRPFILRRTKQQVARELPEKTEQTIWCELEPAQRRLYDDLRNHYRGSLLKRIETEGVAKSKMHVLEALLRLRQAACHPGLIDPARAGQPSAKLDVLADHLSEVVEEGHKALVFSQFTSLLQLVRTRLDASGLVYEYLDGATRDRQARVERFQNDAACPLFLISLKAGGLGLNLTAAGYVFLLDPWWNPAVEAQAIDRTHRIGQAQHVFAYRLIASGTVEEKILQLQNTKRDLAAAIIGEDNSLIRNLQREDIELLLS